MLVYRNALAPRICKQIAALPVDGNPKRGERVSSRKLDLHDPHLIDLAEVVRALFATAEREHYRAVVAAGIVETKLMEYRPGTFMRMHRDNEYEGAIFPGIVARPPVVRIPYACCFYLTAPTKYDGGELVVEGHSPMRPKRGDAVFIRGDVPHSVNEITRGTRHIIKVVAGTEPTTTWRFRGGGWR